MGWHGHLHLAYRRDGDTTVAHDRHHGPLRVLQRLYPEGPAICHHVLVHPPGGMVGGDALEIELSLAEHSHALVTTPGAARFYRSNGEVALQRVGARLAEGARLEWLPLETIAYSGCLAENRQCFDLARGAQMIGWDLLALGLPAADQPFERGHVLQRIELPGRWLEQGLIEAADTTLLDSPLGLDAQRVLGTAWFAAGSSPPEALRAALIDAARELAAASGLAARAGATAPHESVVLLRVLAQRVEPVLQLFTAVRARWRELAWGLRGEAPRVWRT